MTFGARPSPKWLFYLAWVASTAVSIPIAAFLASTVVSLLKDLVGPTMQVAGQTRITEDFLASYLLMIGLGLVSGVLQYLLLRLYLSGMGWWIAATVLGFVGGLLVSHQAIEAFQSPLSRMWLAITTTALVGASLGSFQWLALRQHLRHAALWIPSSTIGWAIVGWGAITLSNEMVLPAIATLLVPGIATSIALWFLLDRLPTRDRPFAPTAA